MKVKGMCRHDGNIKNNRQEITMVGSRGRAVKWERRLNLDATYMLPAVTQSTPESICKPQYCKRQ